MINVARGAEETKRKSKCKRLQSSQNQLQPNYSYVSGFEKRHGNGDVIRLEQDLVPDAG
jgi:hypothetical protein